MRVFITGGTGLVGSHVVEALRDSGIEVLALARPGSGTSFLERVGARRSDGDLLDPPSLHASRLEGCDALVHAAALVYARARPQEFHEANVEGTRRLLDGARSAGLSRVVHVSSVAVYGGDEVGGRVDEERWLEAEIPEQAIYARSKRLAEQAAWTFHDTAGLGVSTVRPGVVYGERDRALSPRIARLALWPLLPGIGSGRTTFPLVYAGSVAAAIRAILERPASVGRAYNLSADAPLTMERFVALFAAAQGNRARFLRLPGPPVLAAAAVVERIAALLPGPTPRLRRGVRRLLHDNRFDDSRAREELDWRAVLPPEEAVARTVAWLRSGPIRTRR